MNSENDQNNKDVLKEILLEINNLKSEINFIRTEIKEISKSTSNMDNHISFVESVWSVVKSPFAYGLNLYYGNSKHIQHIKRTSIENRLDSELLNNISR